MSGASEIPDHILAGAADACIQYNNLTNWWRSTAYENDDYEHYDLCDRNLEPGWYRAVTNAGGDMPQAAPGFSRCGTVYPIWLQGRTMGFLFVSLKCNNFGLLSTSCAQLNWWHNCIYQYIRRIKNIPVVIPLYISIRILIVFYA